MNRASAPSYDLFKLLVTIVLVVILVLMLLRGCATTATVPRSLENASASDPAQSSVPPVETESTPSSVAESPTSSSAPSASPTTAVATITPTAELTVTPAAESATATPVITVPESSTTPTAETATTAAASEQSASCPTRVPSRLSTGETAQVLQRLNMRSDASITAPILQTNPTGTQVEIIGGPVCTPVGDRAYLWWQIRLPDGAEGWSAESPLNDATYLLEPVP